MPSTEHYLLFNPEQLKLMTRRVAQLGEMHDHSALEELEEIGQVIPVTEDYRFELVPKKLPTPIRKVIQMAHRESGDWICLCDDGTLWEIVGREWFLLPGVPQP